MDRNFKKYLIGIAILVFLSLFNMCNSCNSTRNAKYTQKIVDSLRTEINTSNIKYEIAVKQFEKALKLEGMKSELRMIQATDRKIFDVNRQNELEKEIAKLQNEK